MANGKLYRLIIESNDTPEQVAYFVDLLELDLAEHRDTRLIQAVPQTQSEPLPAAEHIQRELDILLDSRKKSST